ncbi:placenta-specific gene 8 protein-like [Thunnus thynnus]|uniref:placenta-specific gene 8 protein-like n=1 Tax=Thunnus maccoyii TaxID=8240 RepID=UPI001C4B8DC5|nr:placenta-specific gene 8 protein-like [Thunnus maccoyii]|eukprot:superscaffoldBa00000985_g8353
MATNVFINNQQPQPQPPTLIAVHSNQWSTGICDCFDDLNVCCFAYWCFPCFACKTTSEFGECFCLPLLDMLWTSTQMACIPTCIPPISMSLRVAVRNRYGIQGDMTADCVYATFCNVCSWCQVAREIKRRKQTHTIINAQPGLMGAQQYMMTTQPGVITSQPMISAAPQAVLTSM